MGSRRGFTLVELLVVIAIISILAGMVMAAVHHSRLQSYKAECWNNLKQISYGLTMYCDDNRGKSARGETFPGRLTYLFSRKYITNQDVFLCRMDSAHGTAGARADKSNTLWNDFSKTFETGPGGTYGGKGACPCSYFYEVSSEEECTWAPGYVYNADGNPASADDLNLDGVAPVTWAEAKYCQMTYGDQFTVQTDRMDYPPTKFPVVRCSWHAKLASGQYVSGEAGAFINLAYMGNVFSSRPQWEYDATGVSP